MLDAPRQIAKRRLLTAVSLSAAGLILPFGPVVAARHEEKQPEVTPPEDLMREHGVLDRLLLVYEACLRKFDANEDFDPAVISNTAQIVRDFIEDGWSTYLRVCAEHARARAANLTGNY